MKNLVVLVILALSLLTLDGCQLFHGKNSQPMPTQVRVQVFEVPALVLNHFLPPEQQTPVKDSAYTLVIDHNQTASDLLMQGIHSDAGLLLNETRPIGRWPGTLETCIYPTLSGVNPVNGVLKGTVGVRNQFGKRELRLSCQVLHYSRTPGDTPSIDTPISYVGPLPSGPMIFVAPFQRPDGVRLAHVVVFHFSAK
jgi:hypothetical protein